MDSEVIEAISFRDLIFVRSLNVYINRGNYHLIARCNQNACYKLIKIVEDRDYFSVVN